MAKLTRFGIALGLLASGVVFASPGLDSSDRDKIRAEAEALRSEATAVTLKLSQLAGEGKLLQEEGAMQALRALVDQLDEIKARLKQIEERLREAEGATSELRESQSLLDLEVTEARRFRPLIFAQFQYRDSNRPVGSPLALPTQVGVGFSGGREAAFSLRRVHFGATYLIDAQTSFRLGIEAASGVSQDEPQLREARIARVLRKSNRGPDTELWAGHFFLPIGYENARSSAVREFPEHTQYNRALLSGLAFRGAVVRAPIGGNLVGLAGVVGSLSHTDPEQVGRGSMPSGRAAAFGGLRYDTKRIEVGLTHLQGDRPEFQTKGTAGSTTIDGVSVVTPPQPLTAPRVGRRLTYLDGTWTGIFDPSLTLRGEVMWGKDRLPVLASANAQPSGDEARVSAKDMSGWHVQLTWSPRAHLQLFGRLESFDPNLDASGDAISGWGLGVRHFWGPGVSLALTHERFKVSQFSQRPNHGVTTLRYQVRH